MKYRNVIVDQMNEELRLRKIDSPKDVAAESYVLLPSEKNELHKYRKNLKNTLHQPPLRPIRFVDAAFSSYCSDITAKATKSKVRKTLSKLVWQLKRLQPSIDELDMLLAWNEHFTTFPLLGTGKSVGKLNSKKLNQIRKFSALVSDCLNELPNANRGPQDLTVITLIARVDIIFRHFSPHGSLSMSDPNWIGPKANLKFIEALFNFAESKTGIRVNPKKLNSAMEAYIGKTSDAAKKIETTILDYGSEKLALVVNPLFY